MARLPRLSVANLPHLLIQRGHNRQAVFLDDEDRLQFRSLLGEAARSEEVSLHAYALYDGEVRLLATPPQADSLGRMMQVLGRRYGAAFNRRHGRTGGLWEGRFKTTVIEPTVRVLDAMCFVETDGGLRPSEGVGALAVSSLAHHLGRRHDAMVADHAVFWALGNTPFEREAAYRARLEAGLAERVRTELNDAVLKGWPVGGATFLASLAQQTDRRLMPLKRGRPRKSGLPVPN